MSSRGSASRRASVSMRSAGVRSQMTAFVSAGEAAKAESTLSSEAATGLFANCVEAALQRQRLTRHLTEIAKERLGKRTALRKTWDRITTFFSLRSKLALFRVLHVVITLVIWQHFFYIKFRRQEAGVPGGAPNRGLKRFTPPFEFGTMHAILFQIALIPLTMCKGTLAWLATHSPLRSAFPFEHVTEFHIFVGYVFCVLMVISVGVFFFFFGSVCSDHLNGRDPADLCRKFSREIMFTGCICALVCSNSGRDAHPF